ncbi:transposase [Candidatus Poribacteria bacterium]|nr:transposase [Candidatus Poribacteria bacterium]
MVKKAITHLKLDAANRGKLQKLSSVANEYMRVTQAYVDLLIKQEIKEPDKYASVPEKEVQTPLSKRWQRCAWQQACGIVQSWYSNECKNPPILKNICIQANANVVQIEPSITETFDYWLRISTLEPGAPVRIPIQLYDRAKETLASFEKLCTGVTLSFRDGEWYVTFVVERKTKKPEPKKVVGIDIGMVSIVSTSEGRHYGNISEKLRKRVEKSAQKRRRKQKLNACLIKKGKPKVSLSNNRTEAYAKNEIGRALNFMLSELPQGTSVAFERLSVKDMRFKSRQMNRALRASQLGYVRDKLKFKLDERGSRYKSVQPAYSSQQCSKCGFTFKMNRSNQSEFYCLCCGNSANADENAACVIAERFGDDELNKLPFREVETVLAIRFLRRHLVARSATAGPVRDAVQLWLPP